MNRALNKSVPFLCSALFAAQRNLGNSPAPAGLLRRTKQYMARGMNEY
jgi:hypothetical protein